MNDLEAGKPAVVLIVEDEVLVNMLASDLLDEAGYRVIETYNADQALEVLNLREDVRVVFTDVDMPGTLNGFALARFIDMRWPGIGIVVTSGKAGPGQGDLPKKARFLAKPYAPSEMIKAVRAVLYASGELIRVNRTEPAEQTSAPIIPTAIKLHQPHTGIGSAGGLAQPLPEPED